MRSTSTVAVWTWLLRPLNSRKRQFSLDTADDFIDGLCDLTHLSMRVGLYLHPFLRLLALLVRSSARNDPHCDEPMRFIADVLRFDVVQRLPGWIQKRTDLRFVRHAEI